MLFQSISWGFLKGLRTGTEARSEVLSLWAESEVPRSAGLLEWPGVVYSGHSARSEWQSGSRESSFLPQGEQSLLGYHLCVRLAHGQSIPLLGWTSSSQAWLFLLFLQGAPIMSLQGGRRREELGVYMAQFYRSRQSRHYRAYSALCTYPKTYPGHREGILT